MSITEKTFENVLSLMRDELPAQMKHLETFLNQPA